MTFSNFIQDLSRRDILLLSLAYGMIAYVFALTGHKRLNRFLKKTNAIAYLFYRSFSRSFFLLVWIFLITLLLYPSLEFYYSITFEQFLGVAERIGIALFSILFSIYLVGFTKELIVKRGLSHDRINKANLNRLALAMQISFICLFTFLVEDHFKIFLKSNNSTIKGILTAACLMCISLVASYCLHVIIHYYTKKMDKKNNPFFVIFLKSIGGPIICLLLGNFFIYLLEHYLFAQIGNSIDKTYYSYCSLSCLIWAIFRFISLLEKELDKWSDVTSSKTVVQGVTNTIRALLFVLVVVSLWNIFSGKEAGPAGIGTILGGTGFALTIVARPIIANYLGGVMLSFQGNFKVQDWICFVGGEIEGTIEKIGPISTALRTFDKKVIIIPNEYFSSKSIINASRMTHRRILQKIPIGWITTLHAMDKIIQEIRMFVYNHPGIDKTQRIMVHLTNFDKMSMELTIYAFTKTKDWHTYLNVQENILRETKNIIEKHGGTPPLSMPYFSTDNSIG